MVKKIIKTKISKAKKVKKSRSQTSAKSNRGDTSVKSKPDVVNKHVGGSWAYTDAVREHFFAPKNLLWEDPKDAEYDAEGVVGSPACLLGDTSIHVNTNTLASLSQLKIGNKVLSHNSSYNNITKVYKPKYEGELVEIKTRLGNVVCTPDHLIYGMIIQRPKSYFITKENAKKRSVTGWQHASDYKKGDYCLYPIDRTVVPKDYIEIKIDRKQYDYLSKNIPEKILLNENFLELVGYFVSDGHTKEDFSELGFTFSIDQIDYANRVKYIVSKIFNLETSIRERKDHNRIDVSVYNVHLSKLFRDLFGHNAENKHLSEDLMSLSPKLQSRLIMGMWRGDGHFNQKRIWPRAGYSSISKRLIQQLKQLLLRQDIVPSIYEENAKTKDGVNHKKSYRIHIGDIDSLIKLSRILKIKFVKPREIQKNRVWTDKEFAYLPITSINFQEFSGRLSNLEVDIAHTYVTDAFLAHNCGDVMRIWLNVDPKEDKITTLKWRTFGCASAIAATSMLSVMITENGGMKIEDALKIRPQDIIIRLGGLPDRKIHCSVLGDKALRAAINHWFKKTDQISRIVVEGQKIVDPNTKVTEADIEEAVLEGAVTVEDVQKKTKVGIGYPECLPQVEELIRFYKEKYFG